MSFLNSTIKSDNISQINIILNNNCRKIIYEKNDVILKNGMPFKYVYYLAEGRVKFIFHTINGDNINTHIENSGSLIGAIPIIKKYNKNPLDVISEETSVIYKIKIDTFNSLIDSSKIFRDYLLNYLAVFNDDIDIRSINLRINKKKDILYNFLINNTNLAQTIDENWYTQKVNYNQQELADFIGTSRMTISTLIKNLCIEGKVRIVNQELQVRICNDDNLQEDMMSLNNQMPYTN